MQIQQIKDIGIITNDLDRSRDFYVRHLGFEAVYASPKYVHLKNGPLELGVMAATAGLPAMPSNGVWLSVEVADVDAEYNRLKAAGLPTDAEPKDQPWGERAFVVRDPNGFGVNISKTIPVDDEFMWSSNQLTHASS